MHYSYLKKISKNDFYYLYYTTELIENIISNNYEDFIILIIILLMNPQKKKIFLSIITPSLKLKIIMRIKKNIKMCFYLE